MVYCFGLGIQSVSVGERNQPTLVMLGLVMLVNSGHQKGVQVTHPQTLMARLIFKVWAVGGLQWVSLYMFLFILYIGLLYRHCIGTANQPQQLQYCTYQHFSNISRSSIYTHFVSLSIFCSIKLSYVQVSQCKEGANDRVQCNVCFALLNLKKIPQKRCCLA